MQRELTRRQILKAGLVLGAGLAASCIGRPAAVVSPRTTPPASPSATPFPSSGPLPWHEANQILAETSLPRIPDAVFRVTDRRYGAAPDGTTDNTTAFRHAVEDCHGRGGGHVLVPSGVYSTGAIHLLSNVDLYLAPGAVLRFNGNAANYPLVFTRYAGIECMNRSPMIYAYGQHDIALTGSGVLDASGTRPWNQGWDYTNLLEPIVGATSPDQRIIPKIGPLRSAFVEPYRCTNVLIQGVTLRQSQFWQLHPTLCTNVTIDSVTTGQTQNPNGDGCDPESCDHVVIKNCTLDASDDCIAIKSGRDDDGRRVNVPSQNIVIYSSSFQGPNAGLACGSEMAGGIRNVYGYDLRTYGRSVAMMLYVKSNLRRGGYVTNLHLDQVTGDHLHLGWGIAHMDYEGQPGGNHLPIFKDWSIRHASGDSNPFVFRLVGRSDDHISGFNVAESAFTNIAQATDQYSNVDGIAFSGVTINGKPVTS